MSLARFAKRRDENEAAIVAALRSVGAVVQTIGEKDAPDLIVGFERRTLLFEVKTLTGKPTPGQVAWHAAWTGDPVRIVRTVEDALAQLGFLVGPVGMWRRCPRNECDGSHPECHAARDHRTGTYPRS